MYLYIWIQYIDSNIDRSYDCTFEKQLCVLFFIKLGERNTRFAEIDTHIDGNIAPTFMDMQSKETFPYWNPGLITGWFMNMGYISPTW